MLSTPPAFVLSQDQTLHDRLFVWLDYFLAFFLKLLRDCFQSAHRLLFVILFSFQRTNRPYATSLCYLTNFLLSSNFLSKTEVFSLLIRPFGDVSYPIISLFLTSTLFLSSFSFIFSLFLPFSFISLFSFLSPFLLIDFVVVVHDYKGLLLP